MNDERVIAGISATIGAVLLICVGLVTTAAWLPLVALLGVTTLAGTVVAGFAAWFAWLSGDRHQLANEIRRREAEMELRRAETQLARDLEQRTPISAEAGDADWGSPSDPRQP